jgi:hypothetical protein
MSIADVNAWRRGRLFFVFVPTPRARTLLTIIADSNSAEIAASAWTSKRQPAGCFWIREILNSQEELARIVARIEVGNSLRFYIGHQYHSQNANTAHANRIAATPIRR